MRAVGGQAIAHAHGEAFRRSAGEQDRVVRTEERADGRVVHPWQAGQLVAQGLGGALE